MCFSQFAQYAPRPVYEYEPPERPEGAPPTAADQDEKLYGPIPMPTEWQRPVTASHSHVQSNGHTVNENGHNHNHATHGNGMNAPAAGVQMAASQNGTSVASVTTQTVEAVVVELSNGTRLLICPLS
jgi:hypothetical protein